MVGDYAGKVYTSLVGLQQQAIVMPVTDNMGAV